MSHPGKLETGNVQREVTMGRSVRWMVLCAALAGCSGEREDGLDSEDRDPVTNGSTDAGTATEVAPTPDKGEPGEGGGMRDAGADPADASFGTDASLATDASFAPDAEPALVQHSLAVAVAGNGEGVVVGTVLGRDGTVIDCAGGDSDCGELLDEGTVVVLTATPSDDSTFEWGGACAGETSNSCTVTLSSARDVRVSFPLRVYTLTVVVQSRFAGRGTVTSTPAGILCATTGVEVTCLMSVEARSTVRLDAAPTRLGGDRDVLDSWGGACASAEGTSCTLDISGDTSVSASFTFIVG